MLLSSHANIKKSSLNLICFQRNRLNYQIDIKEDLNYDINN
jgi:hypothetical protein